MGMSIVIRISLPRLSNMPHRTSSPAPNACDVSVSCAQFVPNGIEMPTIPTNVVARPSPAVMVALFSSPTKYRFDISKVKPRRF